MLEFGTVKILFDKMMMLVALFSWFAVGYCIWFNLIRILPFGILTNEMTITYFHRAVIGWSIIMVAAYLAAIRTWW